MCETTIKKDGSYAVVCRRSNLAGLGVPSSVTDEREDNSRCWPLHHRWGDWQDTTIRSEFGQNSGQVRRCERCGRKRLRSL